MGRVLEQAIEIGLIMIGLIVLCPLAVLLAAVLSLGERGEPRKRGDGVDED